MEPLKAETVLTCDLLDSAIGRAWETGRRPTTLLMTPGVLMGFLENLQDSSRLIRCSASKENKKARMGFMPFDYLFGGCLVRFITTPATTRYEVRLTNMEVGNDLDYCKYITEKTAPDIVGCAENIYTQS